MGISREIRENLKRSSWIRKMFEEGARLKEIHGSENVFDFSLGNPYGDPPPRFYDELKKLLASPARGMHGYMANAGYPEVREAKAEELRKLTGRPFTASDVVMTCGAAGGLNVALKALLDPGDEVIVLSPYFVEYLFYIKNHGGVPRIVETGETFLPDAGKIRETLTDRTKAIIINTPNNPTGRVYGADVLDALSSVLEEHESRSGSPVYLISDEPYRSILYGETIFAPPARHVRNTIVVYSHSKDLNVPGERIGYAAVSPDATAREDVAAAMTFANRTLGFVNAPGMMQRVAGALTGTLPDTEAYRRNRERLLKIFSKCGIEFVPPEGAFYFFPKTPWGLGDEDFVLAAREEKILVVPGGGFGAPGHFRVAFCVDPVVVERSEEAWMRLAGRFS